MVKTISAVLLALLLVTGCTSGTGNSPESTPTNEPTADNGNTNNEPEQPSDEPEVPSNEESDLNDFVLQDTGSTLLYNGLAEYGHLETLAEVQQTGNGKSYVFHGIMNDGTGRTDENGDPLSFQRVVHVTGDAIISSLESEHYEEIKTSLFREKILLQKPIEVEKLWTEPVEYEGTTYNAVSTITSLNENEEGKRVIAVETVVDNMEGYPDNQYKERIELEEGKGLIVFQNNDIRFSPPLTEDGYTFGYGLSAVQ
jgi:hypothetical protein